MSVKMEVWGDYACFTRPEMKVERVSYDMITPSAARGILEAVYWHPGLRYTIDKIYLLSPICFTNIRRNELLSTISASSVQSAMNGGAKELALYAGNDIVQRATLLLQNVHYVIEAHFDMTEKAGERDNPGKFQDILIRRLTKGQCYHQPCMGCREFPAHFRLYPEHSVETVYEGEEKDLGYMLYDMDFRDPMNVTPTFFRAVLKNGILNLSDCEVVR